MGLLLSGCRRLPAPGRCERLFWGLSVQCQRITSDNYKDVIGIARDSALYYQMKKAEKDLAEARETIARFGDPFEAY